MNRKRLPLPLGRRHSWYVDSKVRLGTAPAAQVRSRQPQGFPTHCGGGPLRGHNHQTHRQDDSARGTADDTDRHRGAGRHPRAEAPRSDAGGRDGFFHDPSLTGSSAI